MQSNFAAELDGEVPEMSDEQAMLCDAVGERKYSVCFDCGGLKIVSLSEAREHAEVFDHMVLDFRAARPVN